MQARLAGRLARAVPNYLNTAAWAVSRRFAWSGAPLAIVQGVILSEAGVLLAVRVERQRDAASERQTVLWFSPSHDYNLVRLLQVEDGDHHELNIQKF